MRILWCCTCMCVCVPLELVHHFPNFHKTWYRLKPTGSTLNAGLMLADVRICEVVMGTLKSLLCTKHWGNLH
jgi:hypothetical protein